MLQKDNYVRREAVLKLLRSLDKTMPKPHHFAFTLVAISLPLENLVWTELA